jgi:DNA polymerase-1
MPQKLYLVDASGYIFRAYYAIRPLSTSKGLPTNALFGFTSMLLKLLREEKPDLIGIVFDVARKTFRNEKFPDYKANRAEPPPDLVPQFPYFRKIVKGLNLPVLELPNYEADDVIGTIAKKFEKKGWETVIVTGDKDMMQLVDDRVAILDSMKEKWIRDPEVREKFGVEPKLVPDVLGLAGDSSDNIPGVPGIGEKTAIKLIQDHGSLEAVLKNVATIKGKLGEKLQEFADQARLCKELATIVVDAPLEYDLKDFKVTEPDREALKELFEELEFRKFLSELAPQKTLSAKKYHLISKEKELEQIVKDLKQSNGFAFDTETTALDTMKARLVGLSLSYRKGEAYYIPVGHQYIGVPEQLGWEEVRKGLQPLLEDPGIPKYAQNAKYDYEILKRHGITVTGLEADTLIAAYLLNPDGSHNLDQLAQEYLEHKTTTYKEVVGTGKKEKSFSEIDLETARDYSCEDADVTYRLFEILIPKLKEEGLDSLFREIEMPLVVVLAKMEMNGVKIDVERLKKSSQDYEGKMKELERKVHKAAGSEFNLNSTKQLAQVLFEKMQLPVIRRTKTGYSTDVDVLKELAKTYDVPRLLLEYRSLSKLKSTYLDALPELVNPETGRIHTSFNQTIAATGRLSSSDPNLQNIPIRTEEGKKIREAFIAEKGNKLLSADYSQIELRILAHMSEDKTLLHAFAEDRDVHRATASKIFGVSEEKVTDEMRAVGKTVNFAVLYGQSSYGLSQQLEIPVEEAENYIRNYFAEHQGVTAFKEKVMTEAHKEQKVKTLFGRLRRFPDISSPNANVRAMAERTAFNTIFQGTAADLIKKAMITIQKRIEKEFPKAMMLIQVHDELVFEVPEKEIDSFSKMVKKEMEGVVALKIPLKVDLGAGNNWAEAH